MEPLLSVHIITYNQKDFIKEAIESVLSQNVDFHSEIVIGDDFSTDGTREIIESYKEKYPDKIILNLLKGRGSGKAGRENYDTTLSMCRGKYIAFLDGDDYWTDTNKLNEQVKFLQDNPEFVMCHHDCESILTEGVLYKKEFNNNNQVTGFYEACQITAPFMSSVVIKKNALEYFDRKKFFKGLDYGDFALWVMAALKGKAFYIKKSMAHYRVNIGSITKSLGHDVQVKNRVLFAEKLLNSNYNFDRNFIKKFLCRYYFQYSGIWFSKRKPGNVIRYLYKCIINSIEGISFKKGDYIWISRLKWRVLYKIYFANCLKALKSS
jgi:glycosyltransferase involved in cell wall biosynthesis